MQTAVPSAIEQTSVTQRRSDRTATIRSKDISEILDPLIERISKKITTKDASCILLRENGQIEEYIDNTIIRKENTTNDETILNIITRVAEIFGGQKNNTNRHYGVIPTGLRYLAGIGEIGHPKHNPPVQPDEPYVLLALS